MPLRRTGTLVCRYQRHPELDLVVSPVELDLRSGPVDRSCALELLEAGTNGGVHVRRISAKSSAAEPAACELPDLQAECLCLLAGMDRLVAHA